MVCLYQRAVFFCFRIQFFIADARLIQHCSRHLAIGAGLSGKQKCPPGLCRLRLCIMRAAAGMVSRRFIFGNLLIIQAAVFKLLRLSIVPILNRAIVSGNPAVNLCVFSAGRAGINLTRDIAMPFADRIGG